MFELLALNPRFGVVLVVEVVASTGIEKMPLSGVYCSFVELVYSVATEPDVAAANSGYRVAFVVVSSLIAMDADGELQIGAPLACDVRN